MTWRKVLCGAGVAAAVIVVAMSQIQPAGKSIMEDVNRQKSTFMLPPLPYAYDALEPYIDARTMELHYAHHEKGYVDNLNKAVPGTKWQAMTLEEMFQQASSLPESLRNNAGGHWNHSFYWSILRKASGNPGMSAKLQQALEKAFGSVEAFKQQFKKAGLTRFGSGWAWLIRTPDGELKITSTPNDDNPLMDMVADRGTPLLTCDVWEHAYYLKRQYHRDDYMEAFYSVVDWNRVEELMNQR